MKKKHNETLRFKETPTEYEKKNTMKHQGSKRPQPNMKKKHNETLRFKKTPTEYEKKNTMKH